MIPSIEFVFAQQNDLPQIVATYNSSVNSKSVTADLEPVTIKSKQAWFDEHSQNHRPIWVIKMDGNYAGWMSLSSFYNRPAYDGTVEISIYIEKNFRGKGLGEACLEKVFNSSKELKITNLLGYIFENNNSSLKLFYKMGFEKWGHLPYIANMGDSELSLIIVGKRL